MLISPLFSSAVLLSFVYEMMRLSYEHAQNRHTRGGGIEKGYDN